jgi:Flp pilus assembly secretin CpaC
MIAKMRRRGGAGVFRLAAALSALVILAGPARAASEDGELAITLDQATIMKLPEKVSTIVVGNPLIADVSVQSGGLVVVTGKGFGSTNVIALDRSGSVLLERAITVRGPSGSVVSVYRGMERETYSCTPRCERRITLGDSAAYFTATLGQAGQRDGQASAAGAKSR